MIVLMAGLPGTGKSTLARELAARTSGIVLDKDQIRGALFSEQDIEYSLEQDDFCQQVMVETADYVLRRNPARVVFFDGRTFSRRYQVDQVIRAAEALHQPWRILQCVCSDESARRRLQEQAGEHPARNRDYALYLAVQKKFETITLPKIVIDTEQPFDLCLRMALQAMA